LTGAVISWDHELDAWLNPTLFESRTEGAPRAPMALAAQLEAADPRLQVTWIPLHVEPGHTVLFSVEPRPDPTTGKAQTLDFNQVAVDPVSGEVTGRRFWGTPSLTRENLLPFLYKLHYSLTLPLVNGVDVGVWLMGIVGLAWTIDGLVALWISFPKLSAWRKSFAFRWRAGGHRLLFDAHRSGGVWIWPLLLVISVTSVSMNLGHEVVRPLVGLVSPLSPDPYASRTPRAFDEPATPALPRERALELARAEAARRGWEAPAGGVFYSTLYDLYGVGFFRVGDDHGDGTLGNPYLYFDGRTGRPEGDYVPGTGSAGDIFLQAQFPLHSGRILDLPGRILVSALGLLIAGLSATGIVIWARKRKARLRRQPARPLLQPAE
jgi:uncharacterized iron-regulated membrane protein